MKLLILDKDGTLVTPKSGSQFVQDPTDQKLIPGVTEVLQRYRDDNWEIAIASNQGGVAAGYKTLDDAFLEMEYALSLCNIEYAYFCPDMEGRQCYSIILDSSLTGYYAHKALHRRFIELFRPRSTYRKPGYKMLQEAAFQFGALNINGYFTSNKIMFVGDRPEDQQAAKNAKVDFMWAADWLTAS